MEYNFRNHQPEDITKFTKLQPVHTDVATIIKADYAISPRGVLGLFLRTDIDYKTFYMKKLYKAKVENILLMDTVYEGARYAVTYYHTDKKLYCIWNTCSETDTGSKAKSVSITRLPDACPSCGGPLVSTTTNTHYCYNSGCPAKLIYSLRGFLIEALRDIVTWNVLELTSFDRLITLYRIRRVPDIYSLRACEIDSLYDYSPVEFIGTEMSEVCEFGTIGNIMVDKLQRTKNNVRLFDYLMSLNIVRTQDWHINQTRFSELYPDIPTFLNELLNMSMEKSKLTTCMNEYTYSTLYTYFQNENNLEDVYTLSAYDVFERCSS